MTNRSRSSRIPDLNQPDLFCVGGTETTSPTGTTKVGICRAPETSSAVEPSLTSNVSAPAVPFVRGAGRGDLQRRPLERGSLVGPARHRYAEQQIQTLTLDDMPSYPIDLIASTKRSIKEIATDRVLLTYKEIDAFFGISRATVARRLKDGLVPGIRLRHGRVLEDGSVRRLDRTQLLYLLLAVRAKRTQ